MVTTPVVGRTVIVTHGGDDLWCALDVTAEPGNDYVFGAPVHYVASMNYLHDISVHEITWTSQTGSWPECKKA